MPVVKAAELEFAELPGRAAANPLPAGFGDGACTVRVVRIPPGARTPHRHPHSVEVVYVAEGRGTAWEDGHPTPVQAGDMMTIPVGVAHATAAADDGELLLVCFFPHPTMDGNVEELDGPLITA